MYIYTISSTAGHALVQKLNASSYGGETGNYASFGTFVSLDYDGSSLVVGAPSAMSGLGLVYAFKWQQEDGMFALVKILDDPTCTSGFNLLGISVGISADGRTGEFGA